MYCTPFVLTQQIQYCTAPPPVLTDRICLVQGEALEIRSSLQAMPMKLRVAFLRLKSKREITRLHFIDGWLDTGFIRYFLSLSLEY